LSQLAHAPAPAAADATATLFDQYHARIHAYCLGQLRNRDEADDAVQSTFLYAFALLQRGVTPRAELPWLYTIAHNVCRTRRRSLKRRSRVEAGVDLETLHETVGRNDPSRDELDGLDRSLAELPEAQRHALLLREWQGLSYAEIAAQMNVTESAVEAVLFRARRNLAQKLRAAQRVASFASGVFLLRGARRLSPFAGGGKATAAAVAVGLAAGAAVPLHHSTTHRRSAGPAVIAVVRAAPSRTTPPRSRVHHVAPPRTQAAVAATPAAVVVHGSATVDVAAAATPQPTTPAPQSPPPLAPAEPAAPAPTVPADVPPAASDAPAPAPAASRPADTPPPSGSTVDVPKPPVQLPPPVQDVVDTVTDVVDTVTNALPQLPDVQKLLPPLPTLLPPPDLSPKGTPLQVGP
jgi:RNA polymerase sigma factor (sigma-70 family)